MEKLNNDYLPLYWKEHYSGEYTEICKKYLSVKEMRILTEDRYPKMQKTLVLRKKPKFNQLLPENKDKQVELLADMSIYATLSVWSRSKQVFRFDKDFLNELMKTETLNFSKNAWKFLPCDTFYVDISENQELCQRINSEGFFIKVSEYPQHEMWQLHIVRTIGREKLNFGNIYAWNKDTEIKVSDICNNDLVKTINEDHYFMEDTSEPKEVGITISVLTAQILTYLSSVEPDIRELERIEGTAEQKEPAPKKKKSEKKASENKPSAVRTWEVGVRFGNAFRKWSIIKSSYESERAEGYKLQPHYRKAHWQNYWYGKKDGERIRRAKWVRGCFVNEHLLEGKEIPAVVHECGKNTV